MIDIWIKYLYYQRGYSKHTCDAYEKDARHFARWMKNRRPNAKWSTCTRDDIDAYIAALVDEGMTPATTNRRLASLSSLYRCMIRNGAEIENPVRYESRRKIGKRLPNTIDAGEIKTSIEHSAPREKNAIRLLTATGMRLQEMLDLETQDVEWTAGRIRVHGKGNKERIVPCDTQTLAMLALYTGGKTGKVFDYRSQRDARQSIYDALKPYCKAKQLSPHALRHTYATLLAAKGMPTTTLAALLGHEHVETTQKYVETAGVTTQRQYLEAELWT